MSILGRFFLFLARFLRGFICVCFVVFFGVGWDRHSSSVAFFLFLLVIVGVSLFCFSGFVNCCHVLCSGGSFFLSVGVFGFRMFRKGGFPITV